MCLPKLQTSPLARQTWVVTSVNLTMVGHGMLFGVSNCMIPALQAADSPIKVDQDSASWLNASVSIGCVPTYLLASVIMARFGRRMAILIGLLPCIAGSITCYLALDFYSLLLGRFLGGMGFGALAVVGAVIVGEYTAPQHRGAFLNIKSCSLVVGSTLAHFLGYYFHWRTVMLSMAVPYSLCFLMALTLPESPSWLVLQKRFDESIVAFHWLRGRSAKSKRELTAMIAAQKNVASNKDDTLGKRFVALLIKFTKGNFLKPLGVFTFAAMLLEAGGRHVFPSYAMHFIEQMDSIKTNMFFYTIGLDLVMMFAALASAFLVKVMNRRTVLFVSGAGSVLILLVLSLYYYFQNMSVISDDWNAVALVLFGLYFVLVNIGCTPISLSLIGEIFPLEHRSIGASLAGVLIAVFMFASLKATPWMLVTVRVYGTFTVYAITMAFSLVFLYLTLPETKDKTLQEIETHFNTKAANLDDQECKRLKDNDLETNNKLLEN